MIRSRHDLRIPLMLSALIASAFAVAAASTFRHEIRPGQIQEECRALEAGARIAYRFVASAPVAFNVHFHKGSAVAYPVNVASSAGEDATFIASSSEEYCWMWTNAGSGVVIVEGSLAARP